MGNGMNNERSAARTRKRRARSYRLIRVFLLIILMFAAGAGGFFLRGNSMFLQALGFPSSITGIETDVAEQAAVTKSVHNSLAVRMDEVEDILASDSLDSYSLDSVTAEVFTAFATAVDDPYMRYYSPERYGELLNTQSEGYAGVGVLFSEYNGQAYAVDVFEGSPAQTEGVREGDFVVSVNGDSSQTWSRSEVASLLSQSNGGSVVITWRRPESLGAEGGTEFTTTLECREYDEQNVSSEYDSDRRVGYVKVKQFTQNSASLVQGALADLEEQGARAYVLDLRDNPGGYLSQAVDIASLFMTSGTVVGIETVDGQTAKAASGEPATKLPLVVLVNKNTAAAAEVVAAALKESQRATLVGETTLGKGSVQVLHELSFGGAIRYTAAYYLTPEGHAIDKVGVTPDVTLNNSESEDSQKDLAIEMATSQITVG